MNRDQLRIDIGEKRRDIAEKLARDIFSGRRRFAKGRIVFVQKLVVELIVDDFTRTLFDFTDVDQHPRDRVNPAAENEIGNVIAAGAVVRARFRTKRGQVFVVGPA